MEISCQAGIANNREFAFTNTLIMPLETSLSTGHFCTMVFPATLLYCLFYKDTALMRMVFTLYLKGVGSFGVCQRPDSYRDRLDSVNYVILNYKI